MKRCLFIICGLLFLTSASASEKRTEVDIWKAVQTARELSKRYGGQQVLFVTDLDNTLLKMKQDLGAEPWFHWQNGLLKEKDSEQRVACDFPDLIRYNTVAMQLTDVEPVQDDQAKAIRAMQDLRVRTMALTSRGIALASATFTHLESAKLDFTRTSPRSYDFPSEPFEPYDLKHPLKSGLAEDDLARLKVTSVKPALYQRGVYFCEGQHKGAVLKSFLHRMGLKVKAIIFWDNEQNNNDRVFDAFSNTDIEVIAFRASRQDADIERFKNADKQSVTNHFMMMRKVLDNVFAYTRPCELAIDPQKRPD